MESTPGTAELFDHAPVGLWAAGPDGSRTYFNRQWLAFTGRTLAAERDNGWTEGIHPDDFERCLGTYLRAVHGRRAYELEYRLRRFDGEYRWMHDTGVPHYAEDGTFVAYVGSAVDITDRRRAQDERERLLQDAEAASRAKDQFLATLSHELRTPLNAVVGWAHMLRSGKLDEAASARAIETIDRNARAQSQLISDILDISRIVSGKLRLNVRPVDLTPVVEAALDTVRPSAEAKGSRLQAVLDPGAGPVSGDRAGAGVEHGLETAALGLRGRAHGVERRFHDRSEVDGTDVQPQLAGHDARDVEDVRDELALGAGVAVDRLDRARRGRLVQLARAQHVGPAHHRVQGRAQLLGEGGQELILGPAGCFRVLQQTLTLVLGPPPVRDVHRRPHVGDEGPVFGIVRHPRVVHPAVLAVEAAQTVLELVGPPSVHRAQVGPEASLEIVGVDSLRPAVVPLRGQRAAGEGQPLPVEIGAGAVGAGGPEAHGGVVEERGRAGGRFHQAIPQGTAGPRGGQGPRPS